MIGKHAESLVKSQEPEIVDAVKEEFASKVKIIAEIENVYKTVPNLQESLLYYTLHATNVIYFAEVKRQPLENDVLQNVFEKILQLKRKWYYKKVPDFLNFLRMAIFSYLRNERNKIDNLVSIETGEESNTLLIDLLSEYVNKYPADSLVNENFEQLVERCLNEFNGDDIAYFVFEEIMENSKSNIVIAKNLGLEVKDVENAKKRIKPKMVKLLNKN